MNSSMAPGVVMPGAQGSMLLGRLSLAQHLRGACRRFSGSLLPAGGARPCNASSPIRPSFTSQSVSVRAAASVEAPAQDAGVFVSIDNAQDSVFTVVTISGYNRPGLLTSISGTFRDLGLDVGKVILHSAALIEPSWYLGVQQDLKSLLEWCAGPIPAKWVRYAGCP